jgi:hypothetical protein
MSLEKKVKAVRRIPDWKFEELIEERLSELLEEYRKVLKIYNSYLSAKEDYVIKCYSDGEEFWYEKTERKQIGFRK